MKAGYKPGDKIETEEEMATIFGTSRYKIRMVFNALVQEGVLTKSPRRGTFINHFDPRSFIGNLKFSYQVSDYDLYEFIEARIIIESAIMPIVVKRATPVQISAMEDTVERMHTHKDDPPKADEADRDFHIILLEACGNELLASLSNIVTLLFHNSEYRKKYWSPDIITRLADEHQKIINAIKEGNTELAVDYHRNHLHYKQKIQQGKS